MPSPASQSTLIQSNIAVLDSVIHYRQLWPRPFRTVVSAAILVFSCAPLAFHPSTAQAEEQPPVSFALGSTIDGLVAVGDSPSRGRELDLTDATLDLDLGALTAWPGLTARLRGQISGGSEPNDDVGTLAGIDNAEVSRQRTRLYEAWLDQSFADGAASVRLGLYDLNTEFYATDSSALLIAPRYGIGSELAATGSNGPSIYPSTAVTLRMRLQDSHGRYLQAAVLNANANGLGDPGGIDSRFGDGVLAIAQGGWQGDAGSWGLGAWRYSERQDDLFDVDGSGNPVQRHGQGVYGLAEYRIGKSVAFLRGGVSDGRTGPFKASWQAGMLMSPVFSGREDSQVSVGLGQDLVGQAFRSASAAGGAPLGGTETALELTYSDRLARHLSLQPDVQIIHRAGAIPGRDLVTVLTLRVKLDY
ncbi:MAG: hypothetical protein JWM33_3770 [Caulobacteraceae bacterium]|nr:hypothetical protein [Caulobacteraceae bacterium]